LFAERKEKRQDKRSVHRKGEKKKRARTMCHACVVKEGEKKGEKQHGVLAGKGEQVGSRRLKKKEKEEGSTSLTLV